MDKDRVAQNSRTPRNRKLPLPNGATPKNGNIRTGIDNNNESPDWTSDAAGMERFDETPTRDLARTASESSPEKSGVAYISETLIRRLTKEQNLQLITSLHITLGKDLNKKVKYIENLDKLKKLQHLNLNGHMIEKIEKLDPLIQLRELHLANNKISKIEGLDCLVHLQVLNLSGNLIEHLPVGPFKKLKELQALHVAHNKLTSLVEVTKLRPLPDLTSFSMEGNAMSELHHSRQFVIFQLRTLEYLDRRKILDDERKMADERFAQEEVRRLEAEISRQERDNELLRNEKLQARNEVEELKRSYSEQKLQSLEDAKKMKDLRRELEAKEELLKSKTAELSKACEKQFKLEQELAFYKLDAKFKHLGMMPLPEGVEFGDGEDDESPYIGKARFKPNKFTRESNVPSDEQYSMSHLTPLGSRFVDRYDKQNQLLQQEIHDALILDLQEKEEAIKQAEEALAQLNDQLNRRKTQLQDAGDKLALVRQAIEDQAQLLGDEERKLIEAIADKTNYIRKLQQVAKELEDRLNKVADDITQREEEANKLQQTIRSTSPDDPAFPHLQTKLAAKEQQLMELRGEYGKLKQDYDKAQARLQEERAALKNLDGQLQSLRRAHGDQDELREELKNIIDDLNDNLNHMKQQVTQQAKQISQLQHENDVLQQQKSASNKQLKDNIAKLQEQLKLNEDALDKERKNGDMLRHRISDLECQVSEGTSLEPVLAELKNKVHEAEAEVARLQNALNKAKQQFQDDRQAAVERLRREQEKVEKALQAARNAGNKDRENKDLLAKIDALTATNASLADRLKEAEDELGNLESLLDKGEVLERLNALVDDIKSNTEEVRPPLSDADDLGRALADLHHKYLDLINDLKHERREKSRRDREADGELELVRAKLLNAESALKEMRDKCSQLAQEKDERDARLKKMALELKKLEDKLGKQERLEDELKKERKAHDLELGRLKDQVAMLSDQLKTSQEDIDDELSNATEPLRAKIRHLENGMQQLQNKLSKAKADNERLKAAVSAAEAGRGDLEEKIEELMDELRETKVQAEKNGKYALQKGVLENKVKALQDELERARERLKSLRTEAADKLQAEKERAAFRIGRLEDEIDDLKNRLRRLQNTADDELTRMKKDGARKVKDLEDKVGNLRNQLQEEREKRDQELMRARRKEEALQGLLGESQARLQETAQKSHSQEAMMQDLQQQINGLRNSLKEAETQAMKEQLDKELQAVKAEQRKAAVQAAAAKQLADAEQQVETLNSVLDAKDRQLHDQIKLGAQNASDLAAQRGEISNLASALAAQSKELDRLKEDLAQISRAHVIPAYSHIPDPSLTALANEVDALRAALVDKEQQVERLTRSLPVPPYPQLTRASQPAPAVGTLMYGAPVAPATGHGHVTTLLPGSTGLVAAPATLITSTQSTAPSHTVHHYHQFTKAGAQGKKKAKSLTLPVASSTISPVIAGTTTVTSGAPSSPVHHHFYDETAGQGDERDEKKRRKKKAREEVFLCNIPEHDGLEYEVGLLEGLLSSSQQAQKSQSQRDSLRMDLKDLETEKLVLRRQGIEAQQIEIIKQVDKVENSLKRRAASRQNQQHSLDATLAKFQDHLLTIVDHKSRLPSLS